MNLKYTGVGTRVLNFVIDTIFVFLIAFFAFKVYKWYVLYYRIPYFNFGWFFSGAILLYYIPLEAFFSKTAGKWFTQTRVVNRKGFKASFGAIILRSLIRITIIDMFFIPFLDKPLHDYLSKTEVVQE
jgi:uncharacterized RDD family membrane protein YckC